MQTDNTKPGRAEERVRRLVSAIERLVLYSLSAMMIVVVAVSTAELGWLLLKDLFSPPIGFVTIDELLELFAFFLLILIGLELLETVRAYFKSRVVHVEAVIEVALIALARKAIVLDFEKYSSATILSLAALVLALGGAIYLQRKARAIPLGQNPP